MEKSNSKNFNIIMIFAVVILLLITIGLSFAWYQAKIANSVINNLQTAGIKIDLNTKEYNKLTPDILIEGVLNNTNTLPYDYSSNKSKYVEKSGNTVTVKEDVKIIFGSYVNKDGTTSGTYTTATFTISVKYQDKTGEAVSLSNKDISNYFDIKYAMVTKGANYTLASYTSEFTKTGSGENNYDLHLSVAYRLPDEKLPAELVNSSCITIYIEAELS